MVCTRLNYIVVHKLVRAFVNFSIAYLETEEPSKYDQNFCETF